MILANLLRNSPAQRSLARLNPWEFLTVWRAEPALCGLLSVSVRALILGLLAVAVLALVRRRRGAALAHAVWTSVVCGMLGLLFIGPALPSLHLRVLREDPVLSAPLTAPAIATEDLVVAEMPVLSRTPLNWPVIFLSLYFAVTAVFLIRLLAGVVVVRKLLRSIRSCGDGFYESGSIAVPLTVGWLRPRIVLPLDWRTWSLAKLDAVLAHERAHVRRRDPLTGFVADLNKCIFWFHPLAWWAKRQLAFLAEQACDEICLLSMNNREEYAELLLEMAAAVENAQGRVYRHALAMAGPSRLGQRIDAILDSRHAVRPLTKVTFAALIVCAVPAIYAAGAVNLERRPLQLAQTPIEFEVASVRPAPDGGAGMTMILGGPGTDDPTRVTCTNVSLMNLLTLAYDVYPYQVSGPAWLEAERYDIAAKIPPGATKEQYRMMLQSLLAERFHLGLHHESKEFQVYELTVGKNGPKFKRSAMAEPSGPEPPAPSPGAPTKVDKNGFPQLDRPEAIIVTAVEGNVRVARLAVKAQPLSALVMLLKARLDEPVVDKTGLEGKYDFTLEFVPASKADGQNDSSRSLLEAVEEQLGLKLDQKKGPVDFLVIDHAERNPTEN